MATHSSVLAWRIPGMGEPGGLPSVGSHRVGHDGSNLAAAAAAAAAAASQSEMTGSGVTHTEWTRGQSQGHRIESEVWKQPRTSKWRHMWAEQDKAMMCVAIPSDNLSQGTGTRNGTSKN